MKRLILVAGSDADANGTDRNGFDEVLVEPVSRAQISRLLGDAGDPVAPILAEPLRVEAGRVQIAAAPGTGIAWDEAAVAAYAFEP